MSELAFDAAAVDALFCAFDRTEQPGFAVGVAVKGRPVYRRAFGLASVEQPLLLTPTTRMRIGSTSKHFTCLCIMLLQEDGRLSVDDSVRRHLPELGEWAEGVTLAALMSHTSGARDSLDMLMLSAGVLGRPSGLPEDAQQRIMADLRSVNFQPGGNWSYCNGGYVLLSQVIDRVAGVPYETFLVERVLRPIGMHDTLPRPLDTSMVPRSASQHSPDGRGGWNRGLFGPYIRGEGSLVSTVDDMLRWLAHMSASTVGSAETWAAMQTPVRVNGGVSTGYGYGLFVGEHRGARIVHHAGGVVGGTSQMLKVLDHDLDIIVICNAGGLANPSDLAKAIIDACVPDLTPAPVLTDPAPVVGAFHSAATGRLLVLAEQGGKQVIDFGAAKAPVRARPDGSIDCAMILNPDAKVRLSAAEVTWEEYGLIDRLEPLGEAPATPDLSILGRYRLPELQAEAEVTAAADALHLTFRGPYGGLTYALTQRAPDLWLGTAVGSTLPIVNTPVERDGRDLLISSGRTWRLRLSRVD
jgi:CubicO group peptidase (beta-lactamase class C family)